MFRWLARLLYDSTPAEFRSAYGLTESIERLKAHSKRSVFSALSDTTAVGKVSEKVVRLQRVIPMVGNSFKPFFVGHFEVRGVATVLIGKFTMSPLVKVFMSFWFAMCGLFAGAVLAGAIKSQSSTSALFLLQPLLMIGLGIALVASGKWFARNDAAWLSEVIAVALGTSRDKAGVAPDTLVNHADTVPMPLKIAAIFVAANGAMALAAGVVGLHLWPSLAQTTVNTTSAEWGDWNFVFAIPIIALAIGIWFRRPWAWWGGFLLLALSVAWSLFSMSVRVDVGMPIAVKAVFAIFSCLIVGIWSRWWYGQRKHFL